MANYSTTHASALRTLERKGATVAFTLATPGTYDASTDSYTGASTVTIPGAAIQVDGDPDTYARLSLVQSTAPSLFFAPETLGSLPAPGHAVTWGGKTLTVRDVAPIAPNGVAIAATIVVAA